MDREEKIYLWCPRLRNGGKRAIEVCRVCKRRRDCQSYQNAVQPRLFST